MVMLVLAVVWAGVIVLWIRSRAASGSFHDSVGMFSQHLHVLERTGPTTVRAANRMRGPSLVSQSPYRPVPRGQSGVRAPGITTGSLRYAAPSAQALRRRQSQKRRRDVLFLLVASAAGTLIIGIIPGLHAVLKVNLVMDLLLAIYVGLLVRMRNLVAERSHAQVVWLPRVHPVPSGAVRRGTGRYASLASAADGHELALGRVANFN